MKRRANGEGSLFFRKSTGKWEGRYSVFDERGVKHTKTITGKNKSEVAEKLRKASVVSEGQTYNFQTCDTLENYASYWESLMIKRQKMHPDDPTNYKPKTIETYMQALRRVLLPELGKRRINRITSRDIKQTIQRVNNEFGNTRQCQISRDAISAVMKLAIDEEKISTNPATGVIVPRYTKKEKEIWSTEELKLFIQAAQDDRLYLMFMLIVECGLRRGEALGLRKADCNFNENYISVKQQVVVVKNKPVITTPKTQSSIRDIPITEKLSELLQQFIAEDGSDCDLLFHTKNNTPIAPRNFERSYKAVVDKAGIKYLSPHSLRHSFCTDLCRSGVDMKTNQVLMGHADPAVTMKVYQHVNLQQKINATRKISDFRSFNLGIAYS